MDSVYWTTDWGIKEWSRQQNMRWEMRQQKKLMTTSALKILESPISEWPQRLNSSRASYHDLEATLSTIAQRAALLSAYIMHRYTSGCGEHTHKDSAAYANRTLIKVRGALGYTYPERGIQM